MVLDYGQLDIILKVLYQSSCLIDFLYYSYYANQKKTLEVNPRHPLVKELLKRVETDKEDKTAKDLARVLFETATLRSGYIIKVSLTL